MKLNILSLLLLLSLKFYGQSTKQICGDTNYYYSRVSRHDKKINRPPLIESTDSFHFVFRSSGSIIDIWTNDYYKYNGLITIYIYHHSHQQKKNTKESSEVRYMQFPIDSVRAKQVINLFQPIALIPSENSIVGWKKNFFDGSSDIIEVETPLSYCMKKYGNIRAQDSSIPESKALLKFKDSLNSILNLDLIFREFHRTLVSGTYSWDGGPFGFSMYRPWGCDSNLKKPYSSYLLSMEDTLRKSITDSLEKIIMSYGGLKCYMDFCIEYSKNNQFLKIATGHKVRGIKSKFIVFGCKRKVRKAFKKINTDIMNSPGNYWIVLRYDAEKVHINL